MEELDRPEEIYDFIYKKCPEIFAFNEFTDFWSTENVLSFKLVEGITPFRGWVHIEETEKNKYIVKLFHRNLETLEIIIDFEISNITLDEIVVVMHKQLW